MVGKRICARERFSRRHTGGDGGRRTGFQNRRDGQRNAGLVAWGEIMGSIASSPDSDGGIRGDSEPLAAVPLRAAPDAGL